MKNLGAFVTFLRIYIPGSGAGPKKLRLWLQQKVAAPPTPAPQHEKEYFEAKKFK
jgi:hypothetical protein